MTCCKTCRGCTHRGSQDDEYVCVGVTGLLLSIELPPKLSKHLRASQRLSAHLLVHLVIVCPCCGYSLPNGYMNDTVWWNFNCHPCLAEKFSELILPPIVAGGVIAYEPLHSSSLGVYCTTSHKMKSIKNQIRFGSLEEILPIHYNSHFRSF